MPRPVSVVGVSVPSSFDGLSPLKTLSVSTWSASLTRVFRLSGLTTYWSPAPGRPATAARRRPRPSEGHAASRRRAAGSRSVPRSPSRASPVMSSASRRSRPAAVANARRRASIAHVADRAGAAAEAAGADASTGHGAASESTVERPAVPATSGTPSRVMTPAVGSTVEADRRTDGERAPFLRVTIRRLSPRRPIAHLDARSAAGGDRAPRARCATRDGHLVARRAPCTEKGSPSRVSRPGLADAGQAGERDRGLRPADACRGSRLVGRAAELDERLSVTGAPLQRIGRR